MFIKREGSSFCLRDWLQELEPPTHMGLATIFQEMESSPRGIRPKITKRSTKDEGFSTKGCAMDVKVPLFFSENSYELTGLCLVMSK